MAFEWKYDGRWSASGKQTLWVISFNPDTGEFYIPGRTWDSLKDAKAWCEEQDRLAAGKAAKPEIPMPKPGEVWGVLDSNNEWVRVYSVDAKWIEFNYFGSTESWLHEKWQAWVRKTGAVDLVADRAALVTEVGEMTRDRDYCCTELAKADAKIYQLAARVKELEQQLATADLGDSVALRSLLAAKTSAEAWKRECEKAQAVAAEAIRERDEMRAERDKCRTHADELYGDNERMQGCLTRYSRERDEAKASRDRLAGGLRKIESLWCHHASHLAQDILAKEGLPS